MHREECPVCGKTEFTHFMDVKDHMITKEDFVIVECDDCKFHFTNPIPSKENIGPYYKSEEYISHSSSNKGIVNFLYNKVRVKTLRQKLRWLASETDGKHLLDIGAGTGHFLKVAENSGYTVTGIEPDADARAFCKREHGIELHPQTDLYKLEDNSADVITMWHVLEHVYDLQKDIQEIKRILKPGGVLFVAVPNMASYDAEYYKEYWAAYDVPRHLYHFKKKDIDKLFCLNDIKLCKVLPMKFDSFYVSMLSEKYKGGNIIKAAIIGLLSNLRSKKGGFSSQVYVLRHDD
ncbi:Methyltransferase domain-containing protein [Lishizhenia tianjinensis]|uniref:Methyltransferase domain-containing protein n=1 Tax=Lishizhenia tianjinensis TaxID=477690 RepID=A0A1I7BB59_9FLAO|nr:class I SAM-dependent methyltransferase [Lishizhenia tianjinensis]SFT84388.1 Methyltransferase domain-containing protein [Lishizhenia tianjinensis]